jgi:hypothetical protein
MSHARKIVEDWREDYNEVRPYSSLKNLTPNQYVQRIGASPLGCYEEEPIYLNFLELLGLIG